MFRTATRTIKAGRPALKASLAPAAAAATASMKTAKLSHYDEVLEESSSEKNDLLVSTFNPAIQFSPESLRGASEILRSGDQPRSFFTYEPNKVRAAVSLWQQLLPDVTPYFALKANPHPLILETVVQSGASIDCASKAEMEAVMGICGTVNNVILSNPCKDVHHLAYAHEHGVPLTVVDSVEEMEKVTATCPDIGVMIRISVSNENARFVLGNKFGCSLDMVDTIARRFAGRANLVGISFHVGSVNEDPASFVDAMKLAERACTLLWSHGFSNARTINMGGGYTSSSFRSIAPIIQSNMNPNLQYIAEPGRFFVEESCNLFLQVTTKRTLDGNTVEYTMNDGLYGSLNCNVYDLYAGYVTPTQLFPYCDAQGRPKTAAAGNAERPSRFWGPTCDGCDKIGKGPVPFPDMDVGDWCLIPKVGAYINPGASFNGFEGADMYPVGAA